MTYLIVSTSFFLLDREIKKIVGEHSCKTINLKDVDLSEAIEDASYSSMFSDDEEIVIIKNLEVVLDNKKENKDMELLLEFVKNNDKTVILTSIKSVPMKSKVGKELNSLIKTINTPIITKPYELANFMNEELRRIKYGMSKETLDLFCNKCASNVDVALQELEKLKLIKGDNTLISKQDVDEYVSNYNMNDIFDFKDAFVNKRIMDADNYLEELENSKAEVVPIIVMLAKEFELIYAIKACAEKRMSNEEIGKSLGNMHPYRVKLLRETGAKYSFEKLESIIKYLCDADRRCVSEDNLGFDEIRKLLIEL